MSRMNNMLLGFYVRGQVAAMGSADKIAARAPQDKRGKLDMVVGGISGAMFSSAGVAYAQNGKANSEAVKPLENLISALGNLLVILVAGATLTMAAWGAFQYVTAGGSTGRASKAKQTLVNVAIGFMALAAVFIGRKVALGLVGSVDSDGTKLNNQLNKPTLK